MFDILSIMTLGRSDRIKRAGKRRLNHEQVKQLLLYGGPALVLSVCLVFVAAVQSPVEGNVSGSVAPEAVSDQPAEEQYADNDIFATALSSGEFASTVLEVSADAGAQYAKETLFIGDSNTAGMMLHSSITNVSMDNGIGIVSMGISHVTNLRCVKFRGMEAVTVPEAVKILQPRRIVITYGTNDFYMTPEKFAETYSNALDVIKEAYPYTDIIIGSIFPITANCSYYTVNMPTIEKFNLELVQLAKKKDVKFLNWSEALKDPATGYCKPEYMAGDGVHLSKKGLEEISMYFRTHSLNTEDKRPKPLNPIPAREPTPPGLLGGGPRTVVDEPEPAGQEEVKGLAIVKFVAGTGGSLTGNASFNAAPGTTVSVTAIPNEGYKLVGPTSFTVPASATPGQEFIVTVVFEKITVDQPTDPPPDNPPPEPPPPPPPPPPVCEYCGGEHLTANCPNPPPPPPPPPPPEEPSGD